MDTTGTSFTGTAPVDGQWWFHVCAVDHAGNWGGVASAGPYLIDTTPPGIAAIASESSTPEGDLMAAKDVLAAITQLMVTFSEPVSNPDGSDAVGDLTNPDHYRVLGLGPDRVLNTLDCGGRPRGNDVEYFWGDLAATDNGEAVTLLQLGSRGLPAGRYALMVCELQDSIGNRLENPLIQYLSVSATNLLLDPNFEDPSLIAWDTISSSGPDIHWGPEDASTPTSGVVVIDPSGGTERFSEITQCFDVSEDLPYSLTGISRIDSAEENLPVLRAVVRFFRNSDCAHLMETAEAVVTIGDTGGAWSTPNSISARAPVGSQSAQVGYVVEGGTAEESVVFLDEVAFFENVVLTDESGAGDIPQ